MVTTKRNVAKHIKLNFKFKLACALMLKLIVLDVIVALVTRWSNAAIMVGIAHAQQTIFKNGLAYT